MKNFDEVIALAQAGESSWDRDVNGNFGVHMKERPPLNRLFGPLHSRGPASGVILLDGKEVAAWGEPDRADLTYSVVKTYIALVAGVAYDQGLLPDVDARIGERLHGIGFDEGNNAKITWRQMLQQTSEWEGTLWDIPDQADRYSTASFGAPAAGSKGDARPLQEPGTYWEYNDIRVNQLARALMYLFERPLPEVFREFIMTPIGASTDWRWVGYDNAWVEINGQRMQSVTGGSHWGGGMSISARDQALIGNMMLNDGKANGKQVLSKEWLAQMYTPCELAHNYGYLIWLNEAPKIFPELPASSRFQIGAGSSFVWMEKEHGMVAVMRWLEKSRANEVFTRLFQVIK
ncbi:serine hydrolase [Bordetella genomosp. 8]|uniref:Serine hydrolase n=1 Tax=Bordetella genomosp. 8 TaxID=1416806 RepID=A0A1W6YRD6_9BORD|nr:serine hydrolase [Bordetella genomosp. 8]ARP83607.1 serine hydrolase [Bordetella genomosp. 8]